MLKRLSPHLLLAAIFLILTLGQEYLFYILKGFPVVYFTPAKYAGLYFIFFVFTFIKNPKSRVACLSFFIFLCPWQLGHLSYFGTQVLPSQIYQMIAQAGEVQGALREELSHFLIPLLFLIVPMGLGIWAVKKIETTFKFKFLGILFSLYLIYNPVRTAVTGNTWGRQPSTRELAGMNIYLSMSYLFGKILPHKWSQSSQTDTKNQSLALVLKKSKIPEWDHVVVILGESLTPHHMSLYGYPKPTTPFLDAKKNDPRFFHTIALSSGVSTDISVAFFMNLGYGPTGVMKAQKGQHCLFKLAKEQGYKTHFLSIQSTEQLRYITPFLCSSSMDDSRSMEQLSPDEPDHQAASDRTLLPHLNKIFEESGPHFIMLHQRGSHAPWNLRSSQESRIFKASAKLERRVADYDHSVIEFDSFYKELDKIIGAVKGKILLLYISDHGESLGENGKWGHGQLIPRAFEVPLMITTYNRDLPPATRNLPPFLTQYNASLYLVQQLGYESNQPPEKYPDDFEIFGNDIDGFAGKVKITYPENGRYEMQLKL